MQFWTGKINFSVPKPAHASCANLLFIETYLQSVLFSQLWFFFLDSAWIYNSLIIDICIVNCEIVCFVVLGFFLCAGICLTGWLQFHTRKKLCWSVISWYSTTAQAKTRLIAKEIITSFWKNRVFWSLLSGSWFQVAGDICPDYSWRYSTCRHIWDRTQKSHMEKKNGIVVFLCFG